MTEMDFKITPESLNPVRAPREQRRFAPILNLKKVGDKAEIRFLEDFFEGKMVPQHFTLPNSEPPNIWPPVTCYKVYGTTCSYCAQDVRLTDGFFWNIVDFTDKQVKLMRFWRLQEKNIRQLYEYYEKHGSILNTNFVFERTEITTPKGKSTRYILTPHQRTKENEIKIINQVVSDSKKYDILAALKPNMAKIITDERKKEKTADPLSDNLLSD